MSIGTWYGDSCGEISNPVWASHNKTLCRSTFINGSQEGISDITSEISLSASTHLSLFYRLHLVLFKPAAPHYVITPVFIWELRSRDGDCTGLQLLVDFLVYFFLNWRILFWNLKCLWWEKTFHWTRYGSYTEKSHEDRTIIEEKRWFSALINLSYYYVLIHWIIICFGSFVTIQNPKIFTLQWQWCTYTPEHCDISVGCVQRCDGAHVWKHHCQSNTFSLN